MLQVLLAYFFKIVTTTYVQSNNDNAVARTGKVSKKIVTTLVPNANSKKEAGNNWFYLINGNEAGVHSRHQKKFTRNTI